MPAEPEISIADAEEFARRLGLAWISPAEPAWLREAVLTIARAGSVVPRVTSKFVQPAFNFSVTPVA